MSTFTSRPPISMSTVPRPLLAAPTVVQIPPAVPMQQSSNATTSVLLHSDRTIIYGCPEGTNVTDQWVHNAVLAPNLPGSQASGAGCFVSYTFTGHTVSMFGGSGPLAGVFGCSIDSSQTTWWNAQGGSNYFVPYSGSCTIQGVAGASPHTVKMVNSPANSGILYFTGLRYLTNISRTAWPSPDFAGCCAPYTFSSIPVIKNLTSTVSSPSSTATGGTGATGGLQIETIMGISLGALALVALAALLVGCMCCRKRGPKLASYGEAFKIFTSNDVEGQPLRRRRTQRRREKSGGTTSGTTTTDTSSSDSDK